jgi:aminomethyltransferase
MVARPSQLRKNQIAAYLWDGVVVWVARTGYTGEDGFEFITPNARLEPIWQKLLAEGQAHGLHPAGLGARDTLRTEVCYPLFGHELDEQTTPLEAGLGAFVAFEKGDFMGRAALLEQKAGGLKKKCVAFKMAEKSAPPRPRYPIWERGPQGRRLGEVTSGTQSPSLGCGIGLGYVPPEWAQAGQSLDIEIRGRRSPAEVAPKPLYRKPVTSAG